MNPGNSESLASVDKAPSVDRFFGVIKSHVDQILRLDDTEQKKYIDTETQSEEVKKGIIQETFRAFSRLTNSLEGLSCILYQLLTQPC